MGERERVFTDIGHLGHPDIAEVVDGIVEEILHEAALFVRGHRGNHLR